MSRINLWINFMTFSAQVITQLPAAEKWVSSVFFVNQSHQLQVIRGFYDWAIIYLAIITGSR